MEESDVSGLGACMVAALGIEWYETRQQIAEDWVHINNRFLPEMGNQLWFAKRFEIYKELYGKLEPLFETWKEL